MLLQISGFNWFRTHSNPIFSKYLMLLIVVDRAWLGHLIASALAADLKASRSLVLKYYRLESYDGTTPYTVIKHDQFSVEDIFSHVLNYYRAT